MLVAANRCRAVGSTAMNCQSSRSHLVLILQLYKVCCRPSSHRAAGPRAIGGFAFVCWRHSHPAWLTKIRGRASLLTSLHHESLEGPMAIKHCLYRRVVPAGTFLDGHNRTLFWMERDLVARVWAACGADGRSCSALILLASRTSASPRHPQPLLFESIYRRVQ